MRILLLGISLLTLTVARAGADQCVGDCDGDGKVSIAELILGVDLALGSASPSDCEAFASPAGTIDIAQLIQAVKNALNGCPTGRYVDNHDGTITDTHTGLIWEKKIGLDYPTQANSTGLHDANNEYAWAGECSLVQAIACQPTASAAASCAQGAEGDRTACGQCLPGQGVCQIPYADRMTTTIWDWVAQLNAGVGFAGHTDWRVPTLAELESIIDYTANDPAMNVAFNGTGCGPQCTDLANPACSCSPGYWTATVTPAGAPDVVLGNGYITVGQIDLYDTTVVRAVRGTWRVPLPRFVDGGDGTITDRKTNLMWEKKVGLGTGPDSTSLHDADNRYNWVGYCSQGVDVFCQPNAAAAAACSEGVQGDQTGCAICQPGQGTCSISSFPFFYPIVATTIWDWLVQLNTAQFAGYSDWRMPTVGELETIIDYTRFHPAVDLIFNGVPCNTPCTDIANPTCSCTQPDLYWSATTFPGDASCTWHVLFNSGWVDIDENGGFFYARAVRGGF
jgi:hypothetical protein